MASTYESDVVAWANEQAALLRSGNLSALDIEHIAEEIEDVGKSEKRELASRMVVLLAHLLKWKFQPTFRGKIWQNTIAVQRLDIAYELDDVPSLKSSLQDEKWLNLVWRKAIVTASNETGLDNLPDVNPWTIEQVLSDGFWPE